MQAQGIPEEEYVFSKYPYVFMQKQLCIFLKSYLNSSIYLLDKWIGWIMYTRHKSWVNVFFCQRFFLQ